MFENIGKKIKGLVKTIFIIESVASVIIGIVILALSEEFNIIGLLVMAGGILVAWLSSWLLYGYGEIIDKLTDIERNTRGAAGDSDVRAELAYKRNEKLERLRAKGLITEEEYQEAVTRG